MKKRKRSEGDELEMPLTAHLEELRRRIIYSIIAVFLFSVLAYIFSDHILSFLLIPYRKFFPEKSIIFIAPTEAFLTYLKVSIITGFFAASPVVIYEIWAFVAPGLYKHERFYVLSVVLPSSILFLAGAAFSFFVILPFGMRFLLSFGGKFLTPMITIREYLSFIFRLSLAFGVAFLAPVAIIILGSLGIITSSDISAFRPYAVVAIFALSAILTPPDVFTQVALALPLIVLFEVGFIGVWLIEKLKRREDEDHSEASLSSTEKP